MTLTRPDSHGVGAGCTRLPAPPSPHRFGRRSLRPVWISSRSHDSADEAAHFRGCLDGRLRWLPAGDERYVGRAGVVVGRHELGYVLGPARGTPALEQVGRELVDAVHGVAEAPGRVLVIRSEPAPYGERVAPGRQPAAGRIGLLRHPRDRGGEALRRDPD